MKQVTNENFILTKNNYDDIIVNILHFTTVEEFKDKVVNIVHSELNNIKLPIIYKYDKYINYENDMLKSEICKHLIIDNIYYYLNSHAANVLPMYNKDNIIYSSCVMLKILYLDNTYLLYVKDKYKDNYTYPGGSVNLNESFEDCACRELFEETGIYLLPNKIKFYKQIKSTTFYFNIPFKKICNYYDSIYQVESEIEFNKICNYKSSDGEITDVVLVDILDLPKLYKTKNILNK